LIPGEADDEACARSDVVDQALRECVRLELARLDKGALLDRGQQHRHEAPRVACTASAQFALAPTIALNCIDGAGSPAAATIPEA
jgi:hypothetical protein